MRLYYEAETNLQNCLINDIVFASSSDSFVLSAYTVEGSTEEGIISGRWKGFDVDEMPPDNNVLDLVNRLDNMMVENISVTGDLMDGQIGYVELKKLELTGGDNESYSFPTSYIDRRIQLEMD